MTPEESQKELIKRFQDFSEKLDVANKIAIDQEEARIQRNKNKRLENVWYGFATALTQREDVHLNDVPRKASDLTDAFLSRYPE